MAGAGPTGPASDYGPPQKCRPRRHPMAFALTDDHRQLSDVVASFAAAHDLRRATREALEGAAEAPGAAWKQIAGLGWAGLHLPERFGGADAGLPELAV